MASWTLEVVIVAEETLHMLMQCPQIRVTIVSAGGFGQPAQILNHRQDGSALRRATEQASAADPAPTAKDQREHNWQQLSA